MLQKWVDLYFDINIYAHYKYALVLVFPLEFIYDNEC